MARGRKTKSSRKTRKTQHKTETMHELFEHELKDIYFAEHKLVGALKKLESESENPEMKEAFNMHCEETQNHIKRLEKVFQTFGKDPKGQRCDGILGLLKEHQVMLKERPIQKIKDIINLGSASKAERYEISAYESLIAIARKHGMEDVISLLEANLAEEQAALEKVRDIMENFDASDVETGMEMAAQIS